MLYGYGEDALTLLLLGAHARAFVEALEGHTPAEPPTVLYRPSFGRGATTRGPDGRPLGTLRSEFGEFDAIVGTAGGTYLIEVKWSGSGGVGRDGALWLAERQVRRHWVMRQYLDAWRGQPSGAWSSWTAFLEHGAGERRDIATRLSAEGVSVPSERKRTRLARSLYDTLSRLDRGGAVRDVVLFARTPGPAGNDRSVSAPTHVCPSGFDLVIADVRNDETGPLMRITESDAGSDRVRYTRVPPTEPALPCPSRDGSET